MIIKTRYRDLPFEEAVKCTPELNSAAMREAWEQHARGLEVSIVSPCLPSKTCGSAFVCDGPFFAIDGVPLRYVVCPHIAEIGD